MRHLAASLLLSVFLVLPAFAQEAVRSPAAFLGYEPGARFTPHHRVLDYVEHVAATSPRVRLQAYGETYQGRPLQVAFVSAPGNLERLEAIRTDNLRRAGLLDGEAAASAPALVWLSYNVHGNEAVGTEAAMQTLYALADPGNEQARAWLDDVVVILDPCLNPDGRERYVQWYRGTAGQTPNPNPDAREHHEPWPGGRTNHYYFDLNRDWAWSTQQETRQRLALYNAWLPHVHVDFHEQGVDEPYYFPPAAEPFHALITDWQRRFQAMTGRNHRRVFDARGWLYFTREVFDLLYPGYGDTWPTFNGAVGMTYEQGGSGRAGLAIVTAEGDTLTLAERIAAHHATGLSTIEVAAAQRARVVEEFRRYFTRSPEAGQADATSRSYVIKGDPVDRLAALAAHLDQQGIAYAYAAASDSARGFRFREGREAPFQIAPGDLVVSADQPKSVLVQVLFEPETALRDSLTYDITAWALPYVYGLDAYALSAPPAGVEVQTSAPGSPDTTSAESTGSTDARPYAYLAEWRSFQDAQFLAAVLQRGIKPRFATQPFEIDGRAYDAGTLILTRAGHEALGDRFDAVLRAAADSLGQPLQATPTGFVTRGADFGSSDVTFLERPRVAVVAGAPTSPNALGEVWHFFEQQLGYPATLLRAEDLQDVRLADYDVLILPDGAYDDMLRPAPMATLKAWIEAGGRLVAMERAAAFFAGKEGFALTRKEQPDSTAAGEGQEPADTLRTYGNREREALSEAVPGALFRVRMDATHPLGFGYDRSYVSLKRSDRAFAFLEDGWNVGVLPNEAHVSGFAGSDAKAQLANTLVFGVQPLGQGEVVYMLDNPLFRGFWYNGRLLFSNAVFLVGQDEAGTY